MMRFGLLLLLLLVGGFPLFIATADTTDRQFDSSSTSLDDQSLSSSLSLRRGGGDCETTPNHDRALQASTPPRLNLTGLDLIRADTDTRITTLVNNQVVVLSTIQTPYALSNPPKLSINATFASPTDIKSVVFGFDKRPRFRVENRAPFSFCGNKGRDFISCGSGLTTGNFTVTATPYTGRNGKGTAGKSVTVSFSLVQGSPPTVRSPVYINCGGLDVKDSLNRTWLADTYYTGGETYCNLNTITNTTLEPIYQCERKGNATYQVPVINGPYNVVLHFAEILYV
jgi:Malectin domain